MVSAGCDTIAQKIPAAISNEQKFSWSLTSLFSTNMAISEKKGQGWRAIPTQ